MIISRETIEAIKVCGFAVHLPQTPRPSWLYFSDESGRIGYLQQEGRDWFKLSTVHVPNRLTGTGFDAGEISTINRQSLAAAFVHAPNWANGRDRESVRKCNNLLVSIAGNR